MNQSKIGLFHKELRNENGLTQEQIAEKFGVSQRKIACNLGPTCRNRFIKPTI